MRLVIHPGFHKTGTKSVQAALQRNAALLAPHVRVLLRDAVQPVADMARGYSRWRRPRHRQSVYDAALALFRDLDASDPRPVLISAEDLAGFMPGRREVSDYGAVPVIMTEIARAAFDGVAPALDLSFCFSTRAPKPWLESLWWQNLRGTRLDMDLKRYRKVAAEVADLDRIVAATAAELPGVRVEAVPLEISTRLPEGPLAPLLELLDLPPDVRAAVIPGPARNQRPALGLEPVFLALNRSALPDEVVAATKQTLLRSARSIEETDHG